MAAIQITQICASPTCPGITTRTDQNGGSARAYLADSSCRQRSGHHGHRRHNSERARIFMQTVVSRTALFCRVWCPCGLRGGLNQAECLGMMSFTDLSSGPSDHLVSLTDQLRLAAAAVAGSDEQG